jgi:hypothetical protein
MPIRLRLTFLGGLFRWGLFSFYFGFFFFVPTGPQRLVVVGGRGLWGGLLVYY